MSRILAPLCTLLLLAPGDPVTKKFAPSDEEFPNPERGLMVFIKLTENGDLGYLREKQVTLVFANVSLAAYRNGPIPAEFLAKLDQGFQRVRNAGLKIVLRFTYSGNTGDPDAPKASVLGHIAQLKPLLQAHGDVLAALQAGFIGAWGEWHGSMHGNDDPGVRREVVQALLDAVPSVRMVQLRTPAFKQAMTGPAPLAEADAFKGTPRARLGHHNDAFFSDANDMGTYAEPVRGKEWMAQEARFVVNGGETTDAPKGGGAEFLAEMERLHWSFVHLRYSDAVRSAWETQGHLGTLRRRLGYRFSLLEATFPSALKPGGQMELSLRLRNDGFAAPFNPRALHVVLSSKAARLDAKLSIDARHWEPGEHKISVKLSIPSKAVRGPYRLGLALPDEAASLASRPEYAARFANAGVWDPKEGLNVLAEELKISDNAPGLSTPGVKEFAELR
jgi:hypothetical protein